MGAWIAKHPWLTLTFVVIVSVLLGVAVGLLLGGAWVGPAAGAAGAALGTVAVARRHRQEELDAAAYQEKVIGELKERTLTELERRRVADDEIDGLATRDPVKSPWDDEGSQPPP